MVFLTLKATFAVERPGDRRRCGLSRHEAPVDDRGRRITFVRRSHIVTELSRLESGVAGFFSLG
jgi:hypothetical protein